MTVLADGRVLAFGGTVSDDTSAMGSAEIYDPSSDTWTEVASGAPQSTHAAARLADGRVITLGGVDGGTQTSARAQIYDPATDSWTLLPDMPSPRAFPAIATRADGTVFVAAGWSTQNGISRRAEVFDLAKGEWRSFSTPSVADGARGVTSNDAIYTVGVAGGRPRVVKLTLVGGSADP